MNRPPPAATRAARAIERIGRLTRERETEAGLPPAQWEALRCLAASNRFSRSPSVVADWLATTRGTASQTLIALERKGLIARASDPRDRRASRLDVTAAGMAVLDNDPLAGVAATIALLPPLHAVALGQALTRVCEEMLGSSRRPGFHACVNCRDYAVASDDAGEGRCGRFDAPMDADEAARACAAHEPR